MKLSNSGAPPSARYVANNFLFLFLPGTTILCTANCSFIRKMVLNMALILLLTITALVINCPLVFGSINGNGEHRVIKVATNGRDNPSCLSNASRPCRSIDYALSSKELNNTLVSIQDGFYPLNRTVSIQYVTGLSIAGSHGFNKTVILCAENNASGFVFRNCENISFVDLEFQSCGSKFKSSSRVQNVPVFSYTALLMEDSKNVQWTGVRVCNSSGIGSVFYDVTGTVIMTDVIFENNVGNMEQLSNLSKNSGTLYNAGGGIYIEFRPTGSTENSTYLLRNCNFSGNVANNRRNDVISDSIGQSYFSLGRGGAMSLISRGDRSRNHLTLDTCFFTNNTALWGAGIFCEVDDRSGNNSITVINSHFLYNVATFAGGGIRVGINSNGVKGLNFVKVQESVFIGNKAKLGGGFSEYQLARKHSTSVVITRCQFINNIAAAASAIHLQRLNANLTDVKIQNSESKQSNTSEQGSLYSYASKISMNGYNIISEAKNTGFILDFCTLVLRGTTHFTNNSGINGGALAMFGHTKIRFTTGSKLILHYNKASKKGGAIYVETPVPLNEKFRTTQLNIYRCFFVFGDNDDDFRDPDIFNTTIDFLGNTAPNSGGSNVWATTLTWCRGKDEKDYNNTALKWKIMRFHGAQHSANATVVTSPKFISSSRAEWNAQPGIPIHPKVILHDENWNTVAGTVRIQVNCTKGSVSASISEVDLIADRTETLHLKGTPGSVYDINLQTLDRSSVAMQIKSRVLKNCPPGFSIKDQTCVCQKISKGVTHCDTNEKPIVYIISSRWGNTKSNKEFATHICPMHYCNCTHHTDIGCLFNPSSQCASGRDPTSRLCSKCQEHFSVHLGAETCERCESDKGVMWILLFAVILIALTFLIMLVNLDTYSTYLNGFLYSYQIIPFFIIDEKYFDYFISLVVSLVNVSGTGEMQKGFCIWTGMNNMQKFALNYLAPVFLIFCTCVIGALSSVCRRCTFNKKTTFRAFVFISVVAYADFTKLSFKILTPVKIQGHYYAYYAAYMPYFGKDHLPFALMALLFGIFIVLGFPVALLFSSHIIRFRGLVKLMGIFDTFRQPFRRERYITDFAVFYFLNRLVLLTLHISLSSGPIHDVIIGITCVIILVIFLVCKPYVDMEMNFFDGLQLTNLAIIAVVFTGVSVAYDNYVRHSLMKLIWALAYVPLICLLYRMILWGAKRWREKSKHTDILYTFYYFRVSLLIFLV